ncbi:MAG TPA: hypothetical protein VH520_01295 [Streptosporangiaceae bacterium]|jgi:hypothetical protein
MKIICVAGAAALVVTLAACSQGASSATKAAGNPAAAQSAGAGGHVATTTTDPCQLLTAPEASALTGASFGPGTEQGVGVGKSCVYGASTKNVLMVDVFQGSSDQLKQVGDEVTAEITQGGHMTPTPVSGLGDEAATYQVSTSIFNGASIFVRKGTAAIYLVDEVTGGQPPTAAALTAAARTALGRLP